MADQFDNRPTLFVIRHLPGPNFRPEVAPTEQDGVAEHFAYVRQLEESGAILLSGPLLAEGAGGLMVLSPRVDAAEASRIAENDPAIKSGLVVADVLPWMITAGDFSNLT
ncbi:YciI family protein [Mycobacterium sp. MOTT36Y]|uniref:YciI family protein n=1 Tax=Mycobacterium sp. MOTT36Y TaxID=1168287 RepID=UPI00025D58DC|nr:YciI family protein [Mycobacterium sp. MOTT36Y]AFJ34610.1 cytoplasmic protein [Mycobacterium sp. MOTT36Y]